MSDTVPIQRALLSVSDKTGLVELAAALHARGVEILSTGGTAKLLREAKIPVTDVSDFTGFPEMMDGRVKTLHPKVHGGLLAVRDKPAHAEAMKAHGIGAIDLVVVNLYPFEETVRAEAAFAEAIENIDIGGPAMIRSAAKNHRFVTVLVEPSDYAAFLKEFNDYQGGVPAAFRKAMAAKAYGRTAAYDAAISGWFAGVTGTEFPDYFSLAGKKGAELRYGENPHQRAAFYRTGAKPRPGIVNAKLLQGKELSYNNLNDADAAFELISEFNEGVPAAAIIKHANPCGAATGKTLLEAYEKALRCDPVSAFGGIVALNGELDEKTAAKIAEIFTEVVIAPGVSAGAKVIFAKKKNLRLLDAGALADPAAKGLAVKTLAGGFLVQTRDHARIAKADVNVVTKRKPSGAEMADLLFAFRVCKHVKSNAIVYAKEGATVGIGAGQMSRLDSARIAAAKAKDAAKAAGLSAPLTKGSAVASDAFFPFADGLLAAVEAGASAVIQPGGSVRDDEVIAAADEAGIAMVFTGVRHFRH
ncbi:MAG TPA: bifunctional phosphoribosylaminoimidazolecarboxamide formyltransferase/IMP cyclohydrolase [Sphingomonadales bacterium]|nr:bifunctional phosphoribosylaminoimidazolecarboxamide formyltransferase/IMP cyclohydrolase [Sphingomonadales bacterium]